MIPSFPKFKKLGLDHKQLIERYISQYPPYSDYNFTSLWAYNTQESIEVSFLNENLVIKFQDYLTSELFYSFLGQRYIQKTVAQLIDHARKKGINPTLKLVPEVVITSDKEIKSTFQVDEDPDNHDYVLSVKELTELQGRRYRGKRNFVVRFQKYYPHHSLAILDVSKKKVQQEILTVFYLWEKRKGTNRTETENELIALKRLLTSADRFNLFTLGILVNNNLVGFSINELVHQKYALIHFEKADFVLTGIFTYLKQQVAKHLAKLDCCFINYEQDLGISGLKKAKLSWHPVHFLKKYKISPKK